MAYIQPRCLIIRTRITQTLRGRRAEPIYQSCLQGYYEGTNTLDTIAALDGTSVALIDFGVSTTTDGVGQSHKRRNEESKSEDAHCRERAECLNLGCSVKTNMFQTSLFIHICAYTLRFCVECTVRHQSPRCRADMNVDVRRMIRL